ncbi:non-ribosomal peptide synthetase [Amycolatopsis lurida]
MTIPLSAAQRRLWVLAELRPDDPFYSIPFAIDLTGELDVPALERAVTEIVRRHPPLRSSIRRDATGELAHVVHPAGPVTIPLAEPGIEDRFAAEPFDLANGPLFRTALVRYGPHAHRLLVNVHHIVFDGPSLHLFTAELTALYRGRELPELPMTYAECLRAQPPASVRYWTDRLSGAPEAMELPLRCARPATSEHRLARHSRLLPREVVDPLVVFARRKRATAFMVTKAACDLLLRQHGAHDVLIGVPLAGRDSAESAGLIGYLTRPVVLRTVLSDEFTFTDVLGLVREDVLDAHTHGELPFDAVLPALGVARDPSYDPFHQVIFGYVGKLPVEVAAGVEFRAAYLTVPTTAVELEITVHETDGGLRADFDYREDLFDPETIEAMAARLETILRRAGADPLATVGELILPDEAEYRQAVVTWNSTRADYPAGRGIHELVEDQADRTPDAIAVVDGDRKWTYRELDERANQVAHQLNALGVGPEAAVGVSLPRTAELLTVLLGVFKAGGVYLPLERNLPVQRLRAMVEDAAPVVILADESTVDMGPPVVPPATGGPVDRVRYPVEAGNAAYILYTSGSTGGPKGVVLEHRNLTNLLTWAHRELGTAAFASVPFISSLSFDVSMWEIFTTLTCGGTVLIAEDAFGLREHTPVSLLTAVPSIHAELLKLGAVPASARTIVSNGEVLPPSVLAGLAGLGTADTIYNMYAPTETTTFSLFNVVRPGESIPLGRPMDNTMAYVLDAHLRPVPPGVVGQLHLGGAGITRGYLNKPSLTADRFLPDPFTDEPGRRMYATGDLVRHAPDGRVLFVGRADHQVKLRGARIELGEVEAALCAHPAVSEACAVVLRGGTDSLAAAVALRAGEPAEPAGLRAHLRELLPGYMVPDRITIADALPLLPSGKLDRKRITQDLAAEPVAVEEDPPASEAEDRVAAAWAAVLGHPVGVNRNFFEAGGNSLALITLRERLREDLGRPVRTVELFRHPTIRAMAAFLANGDQAAVRPELSGRVLARRAAITRRTAERR